MLLGQKVHTAGDTTRYIIDYSQWLDEGVTLSAATIVTDPTTPTPDITIASVTVLPDHGRVSFVLAGGSVNETFTLDTQVTDSREEVKNDTIRFSVIAP